MPSPIKYDNQELFLTEYSQLNFHLSPQVMQNDRFRIKHYIIYHK